MGEALRLGFAGSPEFAATVLSRVLARFEVSAVYCQPPRPAGRGRKVVPCAVQRIAEANAIPVATPRTLRNAEAQRELTNRKLDLLIVTAYGLILPPAVLSTPRLGCVNVHASLLPRWRGAAPVERAIMAGDTHTGISLMQMDEGLDTGPVLAQASCAIAADDTGGTLHAKLAQLGADVLIDYLSRIDDFTPTAQDDRAATYAAKLSAKDAAIDWRDDARTIARRVRALCERMPAFAQRSGERIRILSATATALPDRDVAPGTVLHYGADGLHIACGDGALLVSRVQLTRGKGNPVPVAAAANGFPDLVRPGDVFDAVE